MYSIRMFSFWLERIHFDRRLVVVGGMSFTIILPFLNILKS